MILDFRAPTVTGRPLNAWMPEWSKGADLRSAGQFVRVGSNPTSGSNLFYFLQALESRTRPGSIPG